MTSDHPAAGPQKNRPPERQQAQPPADKSRSVQLDGLRGLAILLVFFHHSGVKPPHYLDWGQMGVRLIFVLTGYLITVSLWKIAARGAAEGGGHLRGLGVFHLRRLARLLPAFYTALAVGAAIGLQDIVEPLWWHLAFATNFKIAEQGYFFGPTAHFWSLALQEQFYLLWPFVSLFVPRKFFPHVLLACLAGAFLYRAGCIHFGVSQYYRWLMLPGSIDAYALGGLLAWLKAERRWPFLPGGEFGSRRLGALMLLSWFANRLLRTGDWGAVGDALPEVFEGVVAAYLIAGCLRGWGGIAGRFFEFRPLRAAGRISYGIFVYHLPILFFCEPYLAKFGVGPGSNPLVWNALMLPLVLAVAAASYRWIEEPILRRAHGKNQG